MAASATGPVTSQGIPTIDPDVDAPDGIGINSIVNYLNGLIIGKPAGIQAGEVIVFDGTNFVRGSRATIGIVVALGG